jgi:hypothetical protein
MNETGNINGLPTQAGIIDIGTAFAKASSLSKFTQDPKTTGLTVETLKESAQHRRLE